MYLGTVRESAQTVIGKVVGYATGNKTDIGSLGQLDGWPKLRAPQNRLPEDFENPPNGHSGTRAKKYQIAQRSDMWLSYQEVKASFESPYK